MHFSQWWNRPPYQNVNVFCIWFAMMLRYSCCILHHFFLFLQRIAFLFIISKMQLNWITVFVRKSCFLLFFRFVLFHWIRCVFVFSILFWYAWCIFMFNVIFVVFFRCYCCCLAPLLLVCFLILRCHSVVHDLPFSVLFSFCVCSKPRKREFILLYYLTRASFVRCSGSHFYCNFFTGWFQFQATLQTNKMKEENV